MGSLNVLALEPYYGGSHRAFIDGWAARSRHEFTVLTLPAHHWKWRMRHGAVNLSQQVGERYRELSSQNSAQVSLANSAESPPWDVIWCSSMMSLTDLIALLPRPLRALPTVAYFHENQLAYPSKTPDQRDVHFAFTNWTTALAATEVWFNSTYNLDSFCGGLKRLFKLAPDHRPKDVDELRQKAMIQPPPIGLTSSPQLLGAASPAQPLGVTPRTPSIELPPHAQSSRPAPRTPSIELAPHAQSSRPAPPTPSAPSIELAPHAQSSRPAPPAPSIEPAPHAQSGGEEPHASAAKARALEEDRLRAPGDPLHVVWAARWEHDKNPEDFFEAVRCLIRAEVPLRLSVMGEQFRSAPEVFARAEKEFAQQLLHFGQQPRDEYQRVLATADVFVSTARHEFFGLSVMEAAASGCFPLLPERLVYPELFGGLDVFYDGTAAHLAARLEQCAERKLAGTLSNPLISARAATHDWSRRMSQLDQRLQDVVDRAGRAPNG